MSKLSELKKNRAQMFEKFSKNLDQKEGGENKKDERFWTVTADKEGNGSAIIRFLPGVESDADGMPYVKILNYSFKTPAGKWYIENSRKTLGEDDPMYEYVNSLWAESKLTGSKTLEEKAKSMGVKRRFISNIIVIKDPANPENEGKVKLFSYGKKIHDMFTAKAKPEFEDENPCYVYDLWEGANFRLRVKKVDKYANYDSSTFDSPSELFGGDEDKLEEVLKSLVKLSEFTDPSNFKSYEELKKRVDSVVVNPTGQYVPSAQESISNEQKNDTTSNDRTNNVSVKKVEIPDDSNDDIDFDALMENLK